MSEEEAKVVEESAAAWPKMVRHYALPPHVIDSLSLVEGTQALCDAARYSTASFVGFLPVPPLSQGVFPTLDAASGAWRGHFV